MNLESEIRSGKYVKELSYFGQPITAPVIKLAAGLGSPALASMLQEAFHRRVGVQMRVQKEVSDDLALSDLGDLQFGEIPWPASSIEFFFEDPELPTVLVSKGTVAEFEHSIPGGVFLEGDRADRITCRMETKDGVSMVLNLKEHIWKQVFTDGEYVPMADVGLSDLPGASTALDRSEDAVLREMLRLTVKVCAYATLPRYKPEPVNEVTRRMGGKVGWRNRPKRPAVRVVYMPSVHSERPGDAGSPETGGKRNYSGHRGYFRVFRHDRYINMKGKRIFVPPMRRVGAPTVRLVVRKPAGI